MGDRIAILVVEDEPFVRLDIVSSLRDADFMVFEASNADEAIALLMMNSSIQVMFTDIDMPGSMDGLKLASAVRDRWPPVKIVVTSGHRHVSPGDLPAEGKFFAKPYDADNVIATIRELAAG